jgi:hypothetical protein
VLANVKAAAGGARGGLHDRQAWEQGTGQLQIHEKPCRSTVWPAAAGSSVPIIVTARLNLGRTGAVDRGAADGAASGPRKDYHDEETPG